MPLKPIELPPAVARPALKRHHGGKLRLFDVKEIFELMREHA